MLQPNTDQIRELAIALLGLASEVEGRESYVLVGWANDNDQLRQCWL